MDGFVIEVDDPRREAVRRLLEEHRMFAGGGMPSDGVHVLDCGAGEAFVPARSLHAAAGFVPWVQGDP